jgi:YVTN family beta-propeller protein
VAAKIAAPGAGEVAVGAGAVWITEGAGTVSRIDPNRNKVVARVKVGGADVCCIAFGEGDVWVSDFGRDTVSRIDAKTNSVVDRIPVAPAPHGLAVADGLSGSRTSTTGQSGESILKGTRSSGGSA